MPDQMKARSIIILCMQYNYVIRILYKLRHHLSLELHIIMMLCTDSYVTAINITIQRLTYNDAGP